MYSVSLLGSNFKYILNLVDVELELIYCARTLVSSILSSCNFLLNTIAILSQKVSDRNFVLYVVNACCISILICFNIFCIFKLLGDLIDLSTLDDFLRDCFFTIEEVGSFVFILLV